MTARPLSEEQIHRAVAEHLDRRSRRDVAWFHAANGERRDKAAAGRLKAMGVKAGIPDLCVIVSGRPLFLELKTERGRLSPAQQQCHAGLRAAGAVVEVAFGLDDAVSRLTAWGVFR